MMAMRIAAAMSALVLAAMAHAQTVEHGAGQSTSAAVSIESRDVDRFWSTYDRVRQTPDRAQQIALIQLQYFDVGSAGLTAFRTSKGCTAERYADQIRQYPRYWDSIRPLSQSAGTRALSIAPFIARFRSLYPQMRPAGMYFVVGCMTSGGTASDGKVLLGTEIALGDPSVDISELSPRMQAFLGPYYATRPAESLNLLAIHEYVHTQQATPGASLLQQSVSEGAADFVAEQITGSLPSLEYVTYGRTHADAIRARFRQEMNNPTADGWLYSSAAESPFGVRDLGYYVGYAICAAYYARAKDANAQQQALREIIELDTANPETVRAFVVASGYFDT